MKTKNRIGEILCGVLTELEHAVQRMNVVFRTTEKQRRVQAPCICDVFSTGSGDSFIKNLTISKSVMH